MYYSRVKFYGGSRVGLRVQEGKKWNKLSIKKSSSVHCLKGSYSMYQFAKVVRLPTGCIQRNDLPVLFLMSVFSMGLKFYLFQLFKFMMKTFLWT